MTPWKQTIRRETGLIEHVCEHGVGHPAWGSADWMALTYPNDEEAVSREELQHSWMIHGCDGCCQKWGWGEASMRESIRIANDIIMQHKDIINALLGERLDSEQFTQKYLPKDES